MSAKCKRCDGNITWNKPYVEGSRPLNTDGTIHECVDLNPKPKTSTGITDNAVTSMTVLAEIEAFREKFGSIESDIKFDALARIYISRMMKR